MSFCDYCGEREAKPNGRFCSDAHRAAWHREHAATGVVKSYRSTPAGGLVLTVEFDPAQIERVHRFQVSDELFISEKHGRK